MFDQQHGRFEFVILDTCKALCLKCGCEVQQAGHEGMCTAAHPQKVLTTSTNSGQGLRFSLHIPRTKLGRRTGKAYFLTLPEAPAFSSEL